MHFSKSYSQLLVTLPPELRNHVFEYRKLKQLINQTVAVLDSLGLSPSVLQSLQTHNDPRQHTVVYEIALDASVLEPRLRLPARHPSDLGNTTRHVYHVDLVVPEQSLSTISRASLVQSVDDPLSANDIIIPLPSEVAFFQLLVSTLSSVSGHMDTLHRDFNSTLASLAASISFRARPVSSTAPKLFSAYSFTNSNVVSLRPCTPAEGRSDLYAWREIFRLYTDMEVFESATESSRGERHVEEAAKRLKSFKDLVRQKRFSLVLPGSREALDVFLALNAFILDMKKFQLANSEAARKILKKHAKRTLFPVPDYILEQGPSGSARRPGLIIRPSLSLPRHLVQAIGEVLLPILPHIDDYSCIICTSIAFRPIRLSCGHFFCVRCLAKMQKRGMANCPTCRARTVLKANPSNVDYGLLNLMVDWFPVESREKMRANEREVTHEQIENLGLSNVGKCRIM